MIINAKNKSNRTSCPSFINSRANWTEFQMELDRKLIYLDSEDAPLEIIASEIKKALIKAANHAIPKSKYKNKRSNNYPAHIVDLIHHKRKLTHYLKSIERMKTGKT